MVFLELMSVDSFMPEWKSCGCEWEKRVQRPSKVYACKTQTGAQQNGLTGSLRNPKQKSNNEMLLSSIFNVCQGAGNSKPSVVIG